MKVLVNSIILIVSIVSAGIAFASDSADRAADGRITVGRVKIEIGDDLYIWNQGEPIPEKTASGFTSPATVMSFVNVQPGDTMPVSALDREVFRASKRLAGSRFFYDVDVAVIPPSNDLSKRTVYVRVTEGFLDRFGGGNAYGMYGRDNIGGERKSFRAYAGYNRAGGEYTDDRLSGTGFIGGAKLYYTSSDLAVRDLIRSRGVDATVFAGYRFTPGLKLVCDARYRFIMINHISKSVKDDEKDREHRGYNRNMIDYASFLPAFYGTLAYGLELSEENISSAGIDGIDARRYHGVLKSSVGTDAISLNVKFSSGVTGGRPAFYDLFDLYTTEDGSVRSGYSPRELFARDFAMMNAELRFGIYEAGIPPVITIRFAGFMFADMAYLSGTRKDMFSQPMKDAYGAGVRILFDSPVFAYFSFSYGFNRDRDGRFVFAGTAGF